jgi:hypothetical protein
MMMSVCRAVAVDHTTGDVYAAETKGVRRIIANGPNKGVMDLSAV